MAPPDLSGRRWGPDEGGDAKAFPGPLVLPIQGRALVTVEKFVESPETSGSSG